MIPRLLLLLSLCAPVLPGQEEEPKGTQLTPTLDLLPKGSTLRNVRIPRYDEDKNPAALLRADLMKVVTENYVSAEKIELLIFEPDGREQLRVDMSAADYNVSNGVLEAHQKLVVTGERFKARGRGAIFQLDSRRGFLHGPVSTSFYPEPEETSMITPSSLPPLPLLLAGTASLATALPEPFTAEELAALEDSLSPSAAPLLAEVAPTRELTTRTEQLSQAATVGFELFVNDLKRPDLLVAAGAEDAPSSPAPKPDPDGLHVTCDGGMYFDAEKGHVVYLENILIKEPRFTMTAGKELKIFLEKKAQPPGAAKTKRDKDDRVKLPAFDGPSSFADIKNIVATGGVEVVKKDVKGDPVKARAATATYDAKTGDIVLRGGFPYVQQGKKYVRAKEAGLYIRVYANGNVYFQPGKWETFANREELEKNR